MLYLRLGCRRCDSMTSPIPIRWLFRHSLHREPSFAGGGSRSRFGSMTSPIPIRWLINLCHEWVFWQRRPANPILRRSRMRSIRLERETPITSATVFIANRHLPAAAAAADFFPAACSSAARQDDAASRHPRRGEDLAIQQLGAVTTEAPLALAFAELIQHEQTAAL